MLEVVYRNSTKDITLGQAATEAYREGISLAVNDGKDITLSIEKEPNSREAD